MARIQYQLIPPQLETDEFIQAEGNHLPRVGETLDLDHPNSDFRGTYRVTRVDYGLSPTADSLEKFKESGRESDLVFEAHERPHVFLEEASD